jgi:ribosome-binding protein aMBF1 (putative translation factor)
MPKTGSIHARAERGNNHTVKIERSEEAARIEAAMAELAERLKIERTRDRFRAELVEFLARRPLLTKKVLSKFVAAMPDNRPRRGKSAVTSSLATKPKGVLGKAINKAREAKGLTRAELAEKAGCHGSSVGYWEAGRGAPGPELRSKLSKVLGIDVDALVAAGRKPNGSAAAHA